MNVSSYLDTLDAQYKELQTFAKQQDVEQLLARAVMWTFNDTKQSNELDGVSEDDRFVTARRALTMQTMYHIQQGTHPIDLWESLVG
jgi:hypothetical protein